MSSESDYSSSYSDEDEVAAPPAMVYTKDYDLHARRLPTKERVVSDVVMPPGAPLTDEECWTNENTPNVAAIREHLRREGRLSREQMHKITDLVYAAFCAEENVLHVPSPVTVCGDVHGQFYDLLKLFEVGGDPATTTYLFLGDYVDRGNFSVEVCILMFCYKILYPSTFFMLRGNHECRHLTDYFTFKEEVEYKYNLDVYDEIMDCFDALPLAAIMNKQFLCVHGGLSPEMRTVDDIMQIDRFTEPPPSGLMCDLLWADPMEDFSPDVTELYEFNSVRGCSSVYSFRATCKFLDENKLLSVIRAHEAQDAGMHRKNDKTGFPSVITLFSAPNYLDSYNNKGAVMRYENNVINIRQFNQSPHPYYLPGFMDVFTWSMPFVVEKVAELLLVFLNLVDDAEADEEELAERLAAEERERKRAALRMKVRGVTRMLNMFKEIRKERQDVMKIGAISADGNHLPEALKKEPAAEVEKKLATSIGSFDTTKSIDIANEKRPAGIDKALQKARETAQSVGSLQRRVSRENIRRLSGSQEKLNTAAIAQALANTRARQEEDTQRPPSPRIEEPSQ